ncbi:MAG: glycosyltransferase [Candidatus Portnoybacteria bacterium]|nr:glycosyltransferase [Candidatus Portnoybacteria bacterium]
MKLIYIANTRMPTEMAHGLQIMKTCEAFAKKGIDIELIVPMRFSISKIGKDDPFKYYQIKNKFKIKKIFCLDLTPLNKFLGPVSFLTQALTFSFFSFIYLLFKKTKYIYGRDRISLLFIKYIKPTIFEIHKIHKFLTKRTAKKARKIIAITQGLKNDLLKKNIEENKILVAPDGIDIEDFQIKKTKEEAREKLNLPQDKNLIMYTGHLYKWKGVESLALASKYLKKEDLIIFVGGIKWYLKNFKNFVKTNNLKNILILGHQDYSKIPYYLRAADCLILTGTRKSKVSKKYTSPIKLFEYMTAKKPIIASNLPSFKEILNQENATFTEPDNPMDIAKKIKQILNNKELSQKLSEKAYNDAKQHTWDNRADKILKFI